MTECYFTPKKDTTSATICANCGKEKIAHTIGEGVKINRMIIFSGSEDHQIEKNNPLDANGKILHEGDSVYTYDIKEDGIYMAKGTIHKNTDHPHISEYYVSYEDGEDCAVLDFNQIWKA